jgi:hypothetical protein
VCKGQSKGGAPALVLLRLATEVLVPETFRIVRIAVGLDILPDPPNKKLSTENAIFRLPNHPEFTTRKTTDRAWNYKDAFEWGQIPRTSGKDDSVMNTAPYLLVTGPRESPTIIFRL